MAQPDRYFDWQEVLDDGQGAPPVCTRRRLRGLWVVFALLSAVVLLRAVQLEVSGGEQLRGAAARPRQKLVELPAERGRILARDGTVLSENRSALALTVDYRYLEQPPDPGWLRALAKRRLPRAERRNARRLAATEAALEEELRSMHARLAGLCGLSSSEWHARRQRIQEQVSTLAARVNRLRRERFDRLQETPAAESGSVSDLLALLFAPDEALPPTVVVIAEQLADHAIVDDLPYEVAAAILASPDAFAGVHIVEHARRTYPQGLLAAHLVGHIGRDDPAPAAQKDGQRFNDTVTGRMGIELAQNSILAGRPGAELRTVDRRGGALSAEIQQPPHAGGDVRLTLDVQLQRLSEALLDRACGRMPGENAIPPVGGAIVVLNVRDGSLLAAASAPRFDPNAFAVSQSDEVADVLSDPRHPLVDRTTKMAIAPGSVFKTVAAIAVLESHATKADEPFHCQGYFREPEWLRCAIFQQSGVGHGDVTLIDALARSCNVYFFHYAAELGPAPLISWGRRCGFGRPTGVDLPDEATGRLPTPEMIKQLEGHAWQAADSQMLAIGQGSLTATPLQVARLMAAIANGGRLVRPHVIQPAAAASSEAGEPIEGLSPATLAAIREGLRRVVADPEGTAYASVRLPSVAIAGKTGTAQTGAEKPDHAWFAGYFPAEHPQWAIVVVLEHGGSAAATGPLVRSLVEQMQRLEYLGPQRNAVRPSIPPGKG